MRRRQAGAEPRARIARHRHDRKAEGVKRVEVTVPAADVALVREVAARLRGGGAEADRLRESPAPLRHRKPAETGQELVEFFLRSPLVGSGIDLERDRSTGPPIDL